MWPFRFEVNAKYVRGATVYVRVYVVSVQNMHRHRPCCDAFTGSHIVSQFMQRET